MTVFEKIKAMDVDEFATWFDESCTHDDDPSIKWWNDTYCAKCESVTGRFVDSEREMEFAYCELYDRCRFFQDMDHVPSSEEMIKMWLESEV